MTISVLMSTYCKEKPQYLHEAMKSIWTDQTRKPDEIVLVEDGPLTPELDAVIRSWKQQLQDTLTLVCNPTNQGLAAALNDGIAVARGELIARMDSDDHSLPDRFSLQERYMQAHPEVDILGGSLQEFNDEGTLHNVRKYPLTMDQVLKTMYRVAPWPIPASCFASVFLMQATVTAASITSVKMSPYGMMQPQAIASSTTCPRSYYCSGETTP